MRKIHYIYDLTQQMRQDFFIIDKKIEYEENLKIMCDEINQFKKILNGYQQFNGGALLNYLNFNTIEEYKNLIQRDQFWSVKMQINLKSDISAYITERKIILDLLEKTKNINSTLFLWKGIFREFPLNMKDEFNRIVFEIIINEMNKLKIKEIHKPIISIKEIYDNLSSYYFINKEVFELFLKKTEDEWFSFKNFKENVIELQQWYIYKISFMDVNRVKSFQKEVNIISNSIKNFYNIQLEPDCYLIERAKDYKLTISHESFYIYYLLDNSMKTEVTKDKVNNDYSSLVFNVLNDLILFVRENKNENILFNITVNNESVIINYSEILNDLIESYLEIIKKSIKSMEKLENIKREFLLRQKLINKEEKNNKKNKI